MRQTIKFDKDELRKSLEDGVSATDALFDKPSFEMEDEEPTYDIAAIGGRYNLGPFDLNLSLGNLLLLSEIDSPLVAGDIKEGDSVSFEDAVTAIYVICLGEEAVAPIMGIKQKLADLNALKPIVAENPQAMEMLLDRAELISGARVKFIQDARKFYEEEFVGYQFEEIFITLQTVLSDVLIAFDDLPIPQDTGTVGVSSEKKKS